MKKAGKASCYNPMPTLNKFWIITMEFMRNHPLIKKLCDNFGAVVCEGVDADEDFQFMSLARAILPTPSTFYWWAAFLSSDGTMVHMPINAIPSASASPPRWCDFYHLPLTATVLYNDWYRKEAYNLCKSYMKKPAPAELVAVFYEYNN